MGTFEVKLDSMKLPVSFSNKSEWVIVGPQGPHLSDSLKSLPIMSVDGGSNFVDRADLWIGDSDSLSGPHKATHEFLLPKEKDKSDLACALDFFEEDHCWRLHFWGLLGGRQDHELFNFGEASDFLASRPDSSIIFYDHSGAEKFHFLSRGQWRFEHQGLFSLGTLKSVHAGLSGNCRYKLSPSQLLRPFSSLGLSNEASGEVIIYASGPVFIYFPQGRS